MELVSKSPFPSEPLLLKICRDGPASQIQHAVSTAGPDGIPVGLLKLVEESVKVVTK